MNPLDVLQRTPKSNCGQCGYPACLAFAANVARSGENPKKCPYINLEGLEIADQEASRLEDLAEQHDVELIRHLQDKIKNIDFTTIAPSLGVTLDRPDSDTLRFSYLGQEVLLGKKMILLDGKEPEDPRDQILLYNYIHSCGGMPPCGEWTGLESLPNSISKVKTLSTYCEERLATLFTGKSYEDIATLCRQVGGESLAESSASAAFTIAVLPYVPQQLLFWDAEPEDGFDAKVKILFDINVLDFLDLESLVFSAERLADRLLLIASDQI